MKNIKSYKSFLNEALSKDTTIKIRNREITNWNQAEKETLDDLKAEVITTALENDNIELVLDTMRNGFDPSHNYYYTLGNILYNQNITLEAIKIIFEDIYKDNKELIDVEIGKNSGKKTYSILQYIIKNTHQSQDEKLSEIVKYLVSIDVSFGLSNTWDNDLPGEACFYKLYKTALTLLELNAPTDDKFISSNLVHAKITKENINTITEIFNRINIEPSIAKLDKMDKKMAELVFRNFDKQLQENPNLISEITVLRFFDKDYVPAWFNDEYGHMKDFEHYTKTLGK